MSTPLAAEMYTVRNAADRDLAATLERIAAIGYLGVELVGLHGTPPAEFRRLVESLDLDVIGGVVLFPGEPEFELYYNGAREVGCRTGITMLQEQHFATPEAVKRTAERCNEFAARARRDGMELLYHNHWWECTPRADGSVALLEFAPLLDGVSFVIDLLWVAAGGLDVAPTLRMLGPKVARLHLKDGPSDPALPQVAVGEGSVDIPAAIAAAPEVDWHAVELDEYAGDPFDALELSYRYLTENGFAYGRGGAPTQTA